MEDLRIRRSAVMVHPEIDGILRIEYYDNSFNGVARFQGRMFESSLNELLKQGWISLERPNFETPKNAR